MNESKLNTLLGSKWTFIGTFKGYGKRPVSVTEGLPKITLCFRDISLTDGEVIKDHSWFPNNGYFRALGELKLGQKVKFVAWVKKYVKNGVESFAFENPHKMELVE